MTTMMLLLIDIAITNVFQSSQAQAARDISKYVFGFNALSANKKNVIPRQDIFNWINSWNIPDISKRSILLLIERLHLKDKNLNLKAEHFLFNIYMILHARSQILACIFSKLYFIIINSSQICSNF